MILFFPPAATLILILFVCHFLPIHEHLYVQLINCQKLHF